MTLCTRTGLRSIAVLCALLTASGVARAQAPVQSQGANFGTASIGRVEMWVGATGGSGSYSWSIADGSLPPGVALRTDIPSYFPSGASAGLIGVATTPGSYFFTLRATSGGLNADQACTLKISALVNKENQLPDAFAGVAYSYSLSALGNAGPAQWSLPSGLPAGMTLNAAGLLSGTPTSAGTYTLVFTLSDGTDTVNQVLIVNVFAMEISTPGELPNAVQGVSYTTPIAVSGGAGDYTFTATGLPDELSIEFSTGTISGTVTSGGSSVGKFSFSVTASDSASVSYTKTMSIDIVGATPALPSIVPANSNIYDCTVGVPCYRTITVQNGGTAPFSWTVSGLPPGMSIRSGSGITTSSVTPGDAQLWGTPTAIGSFNVQLTVTDALAVSVAHAFPMKVSPLLQTGLLQNGTIDTAYSQTLRVLGGTGPYTVVQTGGQLPAGLTVNSGTFALSGTPVESGNFGPVFTYTDSASHTLQIDSFLFINDHGFGISIDTKTLPSATDGSSYSYQLSSCCAESIVWSQIGGTLPPGLLFLQGGQLTGTPSAMTSTYTFLLKATDYFDAANYAARQFTLNVVSLRPSVTPSATGVAPGATVAATVANGPANAGDWVALYAIGAPSTSYMQKQFLNGTQTPPPAGLSGGTLAFTLPLTLGTYELRFFLSDTFTVLATSVPITVGAPSITSSATAVAPGTAVAATVANGPGTTGDWVALYATGAPAASYLQWQYLNGTRTAPTVGLNGATLTFTLPQTPGTYELRFLRNNTFTVLATSVPITVGAPSITPSATSVAAGAAVAVTVANGPSTTGDWVALYVTGAPAASYLQYQYLNGTHTAPTVGLSGARLTFTLPQTSGSYELRFLRNNTFTLLATSVPITAVAPPSVTPSSTTVAPGAAVTATVANGPGTTGDFVALYPIGAPAPNYLQYQYLNGTQTAPTSGLTGAVLTFALPQTPGTYQLRFFRNNTFTLLATSSAITVVASSVTPSATTVAAGATVTATVANGPGITGDWVALYVAGAPAASYLQYQYLNGTHTAPTVGLSAATLTFTLPLTPGTYELRFLRNNTFTVLATSVPITDVAAPSITLSPTTVAPGAAVTATVANGPGTTGDFVALYATGAPAPNYLQYQYLNGTQTAPTSGLSGAALTFTLPQTPGTYELRFFRNNTFTLLATSGVITDVAPPSITLSATTVAPGATVTATIANGPGTTGDFVALYATGATAPSYLQWQYLSGTHTAPAVGPSGAALTFTLPQTPGTYELRFFRNNTFTLLATSGVITVGAPSITLSATVVTPGATVTATIANGPGTTGDFVALYATGAPAPNYLQYQYLNGTHTAPTAGQSGAVLTFTVPQTPGTYELRFFRNNMFTVLATSGPITVQ